MSGDTVKTSTVTGAHADPVAERSPLNPLRWKALALLCAAFFMVQLDAQIVLLALPSIEADLGFTPAGAQWVMSSYLITFGGLLLLGGRTADVAGRRKMFLLGMLLFGAASLLAGLAWSSEILIIGRVGQGVSAALIAPAALALLMTTFTDAKELSKALAIWAANGAIGAMAALLIGGPINDTIGWEWLFFINVPVAVLVLVIGPKLLKESRAEERVGFDPLGALTITLAVVAFIYAVVETPTVGWASPRTLLLLAASVVLFAVFIAIEKRVASPMVPLSLFRNRNLLGGNVVMLLIGMVTFGAVLLVSLYAQQVLQYTALAFGVATVVYTVMSTVGSQIGSRIVAKLGFRNMTLIAVVIMGAGVVWLTRAPVDGTYFVDLFPALVLFGFGLGMGFVSVSIAALTDVPEENSGIASGINTAGFQLGGALGVAVATAVAVAYSGTTGDAKQDLNAGYQSGFWSMVILTVVGIVVTAALFKAPKKAVAA